MKPLEYSDIKRGMTLWDDKNKCVQKVRLVYLWRDILSKYPNRFYAKKPNVSK